MTLMHESDTDAVVPITDLAGYIDELDYATVGSLRALGELLVGAAASKRRTMTADLFVELALGVRDAADLVEESQSLGAVVGLTTALAVGELIAEHADAVAIGPGDFRHPPSWSETEIGGTKFRHPQCLRAYFPAGTVLPDTSVVVGIESRASFSSPAEVGVFAAPDAQTEARAVLDLLSARAVELNPYRGRILRASDQGGLSLSVIELPQLTRENVIVPERVWAEIDLGLTAVRDLHAELNRHGLGTRRGLLLAGPPGTGKSAVSAVVANEVVGDLTVIYVEARAGARLLTAVVEESQQLAPACVILEDVDLWCRDRSVGGGGLSELLQAMDIRSDARILTLASTNDVATLDKAAVRAGRFDAIVEVGFPDGASAARILTTLIADLPGGDQVDTAAVAAALPPQATGADIREIVRRAFLGSGGGGVRTAALLAEIGCGRYRPELPGGTYL